MSESFLDGRVELRAGDCLDVLAGFDPDVFDACVTDPPYHLASIVQRFGADNAAPAKSNGATGVYARASAGFMGQRWDGGDIAFQVETWAAVSRVLKPGAFVLAFGATRNFGFMQVAMAQAGFEIRDTVAWLYGSGFPKSYDVAQCIEKKLTTGRARRPDRDLGGLSRHRFSGTMGEQRQIFSDTGGKLELTADEAREWDGWGTALKPAMELIVLARKPLGEPTVAANVLKWGTGAINIDGCRVPTDDDSLGRWPANVIHDGSAEVVAAFPESQSASVHNRGLNIGMQGGKFAAGERGPWVDNIAGHNDGGGSAARFFYSAKADGDDRLGSRHPTVKPLDLMQYLVRLVTPKGGTVLDPFAGTGTTGEAAYREGMAAVLIEREERYCADIRRRMALVLAGPDERLRESIKAGGEVESPGPVFGGKWE